MAIFEIPFTAIALVEHAAGGAILSHAGGYIAGTYVSASVVEAFATASAVLTSIGGSVAAVATNPVVLGTATIAVAAAGAYCYFYGIPAPIEAVLTKAGLGVAAKNGFAISVPKLAVALVLLGGAGYVMYRFYQTYKSARQASANSDFPTGGQEPAEAAFGFGAWRKFGEAVWSGVSDATERAVQLAQDAVEAMTTATNSAASATGRAANAGSSFASSAIGRLFGRLKTALAR